MVVDALDLHVLEIGPVGRLVTEAMGQVDEFQPHAVVVVLLEHHATDFLRHAIPPRAGICCLNSTTEAAGLYPISFITYREPAPGVSGAGLPNVRVA
jgi:hypothetical protein